MKPIPFPTSYRSERGCIIVSASQIMPHIGRLPTQGEYVIFSLGGNAQARYRVAASSTALLALKFAPRALAEAMPCAA